MYFNNVHILIYLAIGMLGLVTGKFVAWCNVRLPEKKKIFSLDFLKINKQGLPFNYIFMILIAFLNIAVLYKFGIAKDDFFKNLDLIKFIILIPMLVLVFAIDIKHRIIPNRLNLTMFELGLCITFVYGINNVNMAKDYILGMILGTVIFAIITVLGKIITGKEAMGLGDMKFTGAVGLYFGTNTIAEISLTAFLLGAAISILVMIVRIILKKKDEYIAFGPFLSIASVAIIFMPAGIVMDNFLRVCQNISEKILMF